MVAYSKSVDKQIAEAVKTANKWGELKFKEFLTINFSSIYIKSEFPALWEEFFNESDEKWM